MRTLFLLSLPLLVSSFAPISVVPGRTVSLYSTAEAEAPAPSASDDQIPTNLPSDCGMDYIPLATMLATGELAEADQVRHPSRSTALSLSVVRRFALTPCT